MIQSHLAYKTKRSRILFSILLKIKNQSFEIDHSNSSRYWQLERSNSCKLFTRSLGPQEIFSIVQTSNLVLVDFWVVQDNWQRFRCYRDLYIFYQIRTQYSLISRLSKTTGRDFDVIWIYTFSVKFELNVSNTRRLLQIIELIICNDCIKINNTAHEIEFQLLCCIINAKTSELSHQETVTITLISVLIYLRVVQENWKRFQSHRIS